MLSLPRHLVLGCAGLAAALLALATQQAEPAVAGPLRRLEALTPPGWYSGDTHEHVQLCDETLLSPAEILARMEAEDLDVASVLVWQRPRLPFVRLVCSVTGLPHPASSPDRILQFGVETSHLTCSRWGHLIGLGIGPEEARIARGSMAQGACADMEGLGLEGDGSGTLSSRVAQRFLAAPGAVCGYAHALWMEGLHHPDGYDWGTELVDGGITTDAAYLDPAQPLSVPSVERLFGIGHPPTGYRDFFPLLGAMDAVLGNVQFVETIHAGTETRFPTKPPSRWYELYYKLLSAGVRIGLAGGSDRACFPPEPGRTPMRTYVLTDGPLSYGAWIQGLAQGRSTISNGNELFLSLTVEGKGVGSDVALLAPEPKAGIRVELRSTRPVVDSVELVLGGRVVAARGIEMRAGGAVTVAFDDVPMPRSSWVAARLGSQLAHTAAVYVIVDGRPIVDPAAAEYWMLWCDVVAKTTREHLELQSFGRQTREALALVARARRAFQTLRDTAGFDPRWGVYRYGTSTPACRGPIAIGTTGPVRSGRSYRVTCVNAPPEAQGVLVLSRTADLDGTCNGGLRAYVATDPARVLGVHPVRSTRSGYAEVEVGPVPDGIWLVFAQFLWASPKDCPGRGCGRDATRRSASDALALRVR